MLYIYICFNRKITYNWLIFQRAMFDDTGGYPHLFEDSNDFFPEKGPHKYSDAYLWRTLWLPIGG